MKNVLNVLNALAQLDLDAMHAYGKAIARIGVRDVQEELLIFQREHEKHAILLSETILNLGGTPPAFTRDFKGILMEGITAIRSATGTEGALKAMRMNEIMTNRAYDVALQRDLPVAIVEIIEANRDDERRHLRYIESAIARRVWEREKQPARGRLTFARGRFAF